MRYCCIACMSQNLGNTKVNLVTSNNLQFHMHFQVHTDEKLVYRRIF